jgi:putative glutamine amidotransferase
MQYNIGLTMRITNAKSYDELRDTISQDWPRYIEYLFPEANYFFIPNIEENAVSFCENKNINLLIITGGENIGVFKKRDKTELVLLEFMISKKLPVIGICRGMQLIHYYYGGDIIKGNNSFVKEHRATYHNVIIKEATVKVNSYHNCKIKETTLSSNLSILATNVNDRSIEAFIGDKLLGLMWHPERDIQFSKFTKQLIMKFLLNNG